jgi:hypothetical protein
MQDTATFPLAPDLLQHSLLLHRLLKTLQSRQTHTLVLSSRITTVATPTSHQLPIGAIIKSDRVTRLEKSQMSRALYVLTNLENLRRQMRIGHMCRVYTCQRCTHLSR